MTKFRTMAAAGSAVLMALAPVATLADTTIGVYQTTDRKMDYELRMCGKNETQLCVKLLDARGSARTGKVKPWIGKDIVANAKPAGTNRWKGQVHVQNYTMDGTLTLTPGEKFVMAGCTMVVMCADFTLIPAKN